MFIIFFTTIDATFVAQHKWIVITSVFNITVVLLEAVEVYGGGKAGLKRLSHLYPTPYRLLRYPFDKRKYEAVRFAGMPVPIRQSCVGLGRVSAEKSYNSLQPLIIISLL